MLKRKLIYWKNYMLYGRADAIWWDDFYVFATRCGENLDIMLEAERNLKGVAHTGENRMKENARN